MGTVLIETLKESIHRRIALALIVVAILFFVAQVGFTHFSHDAKGELVVTHMDSREPMPAKTFVTAEVIPTSLQMLSNLWVLLTLLATCTLLTSYMDKGWVELLLTKGTPRWKIFAGRYLGAMALFVITALIMNVLSVVYFAMRAGVPVGPYFVSLSFILVSFVSALSLMLLVSTSQANPGLLVLVVFLETILSSTLSLGNQQLFRGVPWKWMVWLLQWAYRIVPKHSELMHMATGYVQTQTVANWFALWSSVVFIFVATAWAFWRFERKAF